MLTVFLRSHGREFHFFKRSDLIELLYNSLPDRERRVIPGKAVILVEQDDTGVKVSCQDGSVYEGDIVLGCDGVHSTIRRLAIEPQIGSGSSTTSSRATTPFKCKYRCMFGHSPRPEGLSSGEMLETHVQGRCFQIMSTEDRTYWLIYDEKDKSEPQERRYTQEDAQAFAQEWSAQGINEGGSITFGDLWQTRYHANVYDLEEGMAPKWYNGRVAILGDASHKVCQDMSPRWLRTPKLTIH